ncbi:hypothetical protein [Legionella cincinnatiensis]|uniref:Transmembrane protein n=1 Tax=Legionella cincinnatiensis TaxID=28085 RepID=A0A378IJT7_9GAMM|nr:hypothetical protein [Legionella cincinnatiensis]KTC83442.1 hypothetical protein Lcin_2129 [Legionella cincinnatiensis]STX35528.1 Uncharacterised protein [Legionella cincinnatiensis]
MSKEKKILLLKNWIEQLVRNPNLYVALAVSALLGGGSGGAIGLFSGGFIGQSFSLCNNPSNFVLNLTPGIMVGALLGLIAGALLGGGITITITLFKIYKKTKNYPVLSHDNIVQVLSASFWINLEIIIGMGLGAIIGSLKSRGVGTLTGAALGLLIIGLTSTLKSPKKSEKTVRN